MMRRVVFILICSCLAACGDKENGSGGSDSADPEDMCVPPDASGHLGATLTGAIEATIDWSDAAMVCGGTMTGATTGLFSFESDLGEERLAFLFTVDGFDGEHGITDAPTRVDLTGSATSEAGAYTGASCTMSLSDPEEVGTYNGLVELAIDGIGTCSQPASGALGDGEVSLSDLSFRAVLGRAAR